MKDKRSGIQPVLIGTKATEFVRDYKSGHSSYGKRAIEVNINIPDNSNKMFEKQFDSFLTYIDVLVVFIADVGKI